MTTVQKLLHSVFSPPRPIHEQKDRHSQNEDHCKNSTKPDAAALEAQRCQFTFSDGRQCRNQHAQFCVHHSSRKQPDFGAAGAPDAALEGLCGDLTTATNINRALAQVFLLMAQGRIPQKQAVAFGYLSQLLLQTVPGIRSEYVSVFGYNAWETNLKSKITSLFPAPAAQTEPPTPTSAPATPSPDYDNLLRRSRDLLDRKSTIRPGSSSRENNVNEGTLSETAKSPDFGNFLRRGRDLLAGKFDTTPEGRREANALALELELLNPAPAKPRRDFFSRTVALVRQLRDFRRERHAVRESPLSRGSEKGQELRGVKDLRCERHGHQELRSVKEVPQPAASAAAPPASAATHASCSSGRGANGVLEARLSSASIRALKESCAPSEPALRPFSPAPQPAPGAPPASEANVPESHLVAPPCPEPPRASRPEPTSSPQHEGPIPGFTLTRTGHSSDWHAPASWSGPQPNPFPSRKEKLQREFRTMSNSKFRRRQLLEQNRHFWR